MKYTSLLWLVCLVALLLSACGEGTPKKTGDGMGTDGSSMLGGMTDNQTQPMTTDAGEQTLGEMMGLVASRFFKDFPLTVSLSDFREVDLQNAEAVKMHLGLSSAEDIEFAGIAEPTANAEPFSLALVRIKDGANADVLKTAMTEGYDKNRWVGTPADKVGAIDCGKIILLVAANKDIADIEAACDTFEAIFGKDNCGDRVIV